ncbi:hypothetical protein EXIGLDRAFT_832414, partial [Exidia glandulosa HHB12029]
MSHLQHLDLNPFIHFFQDDMDDFISVLKELGELNSVQCQWQAIDMDLLLDALPPLKRIDFDADAFWTPAVGRLLLRSIDTLEYFAAAEYDELEDFFALSNVQGRVWPRMRDLEVSVVGSLSIIHAFPSLARLSITSDPPYPADILWDQSLIRDVEQLSFCISGPLPDVSRRGDAVRAVPHLSLEVGLDPEADFSYHDFDAVLRCFALRSLRSLCIEVWSSPGALSAILAALPTLLEGCSCLCYFGLRSDESGEDVNPFHLISSFFGSTSNARRLKFINLDMRGYRVYSATDTLPAVRAHLASVILSSFADNETLRVVQSAGSSWKRRRVAGCGEVREDDVDASNGLPWSLSDIAELVDA